MLGGDVTHSLAMSDINQAQRSLGNKVLCASLGTDVAEKVPD
jgi:hypothetical protein